MADPFARRVPDPLAPPPPAPPSAVALEALGLLATRDARVWLKARVSAQDPATPGRYSWTEVVSDDTAEPAGWAAPGGAASGTHDARELNDHPLVPAGAVVWLRAADGPEGQAWAWEFAFEGAPALGGFGPPSGVSPPGVLYYQLGSGSGSGTGTGTGCGTLWVSCGNGCWAPVLTGDPYCPGSGSGPPPAPPGTVGGKVLYADPPDAPAPGVTVQLQQPAGTVIDAVTSDAGGNYLFASKPAGDYVVHVVPPAGKQVADNDRGVSLYPSQPGAGGVDFYLSTPSGPAHLTPCCTDPVPADLFLTVSGSSNPCLEGTFHLVCTELFPGDFRWLWNGTLCGKPCSWRASCQSAAPNTWTLAFVCDGFSQTVGSPSGSCVPFSVSGNCTVGNANTCVAAGTTFHAVLSE